MPDSNNTLFKYSTYFTKETPEYWVQILILLAISAIFGLLIGVITHYSNFSIYLSIYYLSSGMIIIALPAIISMALIKAMQRKMKLKHISLIALIGAVSYALFILIGTEAFMFSNNAVVFIVILLMGDASLFGFWFIINRFVVINKKRSIIIATVQPVLNILFYIPLHSYLLNITLPASIAFEKLFAGMFVFLVVGYLFIYAVDRPLRKHANISGVTTFAIMINQWLYDASVIDKYYISKFGEEKDIDVDLLLIYKKKDAHALAAVFVEPHIHYGPFAGVGGSSATFRIGNLIAEKYSAAPFVLHGAVNAAYNPISASELDKIEKAVDSEINAATGTTAAYGYISSSIAGVCKAINIKIGNCSLLTLSKAPYVTEDIRKEVGDMFEEYAKQHGLNNVIIIDAHNSRKESESKDELKGIYPGSKYIAYYKRAISEVAKAEGESRVYCGFSYKKISSALGNPKDIGKGYTSICIFKSGKSRFGMIYFDANNMLPNFRAKLLEHLKRKYKFDFEVYTTDTHSVNSLALTASNVLGRETDLNKMIRVIDPMVDEAIADIGEVYSSYKRFEVKNFKIWGDKAEEQIVKAGEDVINIAKHIVPFIIAGGFVIAAWLIYFI